MQLDAVAKVLAKTGASSVVDTVSDPIQGTPMAIPWESWVKAAI